jgi:hypothetical protein
MAQNGQLKENYSKGKSFNVYIPKNSTQITSGDVLVMPRKYDPKSRSRYGALGRVSPIGSQDAAEWSVGVSDCDFTTDTVGSTLYAAPTSNQAIRVYKTGVFKLAIVATSGNAGDFVRYSSGATGAQLFTTTPLAGFAVGILEKTFSGATANDCQLVRLIEKDVNGPDIAYWLENRVVTDCRVHSATNVAKTSAIQVGATYTGNREGQIYVIQGKRFRHTRDTVLNIGRCTGGANSTFKARMIVARSVTFAYRTCSVAAGASVATYNNASVTAGMFVPNTMTSGEIVIGYAIAHSGRIAYSAGRIRPVPGPSKLVRYASWSV